MKRLKPTDIPLEEMAARMRRAGMSKRTIDQFVREVRALPKADQSEPERRRKAA
jgi:hypothetical protein